MTPSNVPAQARQSSHHLRRLKHSNRTRRPAFEHLEDRRVMAVDFASAFAVGGVASESVWDLALDGAGNTCVVGRFFGTTDFDPSAGTYELTSTPSGTGNTFAAKYAPDGSLLWAQRLGGNNANSGPEIAAGSDGSVYVVGSFENTAEIGSFTLTSLGDDDAYVTKLDADGNIVWAKSFGGTGDDWGNGVAVDGVGNVYMMVETRSAATTLPLDAFIAKMDEAGIVQWTTAIGASTAAAPAKGKPAPTGHVRGFKITVDAAGSVYATGSMQGTVDFDASAGATKLSGDAFVMKLSSGGSLTWARTFVSLSIGSGIWPSDITVDGSGNVYSTGSYSLTNDFDPGTAKSQKYTLDAGVSASGVWNRGAYISALDASGNFLWAKSTQSVGGNGYLAVPEAMTLDGQGGIYVAGTFSSYGTFSSGIVDFDSGAGTFSLTSAGGDDAFVWNLDTSGNFVWAGQMAGTGADRARGIGVDAAGNIYVAGSFTGTVDFDPGAGTYNLTSAGGSDFFVAKLTQPVALALTASQPQSNSLLLATTPSRRLSSKAADSALAARGDDGSTGWDDSLDDELLLVLASV